MTVRDVIANFKGHPNKNVEDAFIFAVKDLEKAIKALSDANREKIFMNGKAFMNLEILWPASANVVDYDVAE